MSVAKELADLSHTELDELAAANGITWPDGVGTKAEKADVLTDAGVEVPAVPTYRIRLKLDWFADDVEPVASFMAGHRAVSLAGDEVYETDDRDIWTGLRDVPFLESEVA